MDVHEAFKSLNSEKDVEEFLGQDHDYRLAHAALIREPKSTKAWEFGYYSPTTDRLVVFETNPLRRLPEQEIFKQDGEIPELKFEEVSVTFDDVQKIAKDLNELHYGAEPVTKEIILLQNINGPTWNVTLVTAAMNIVNIRIDAATGEVKSHKKDSLMGIGRRI